MPESLAAGADVTLFSGDKLLGGPQCGIILGKKAPLAAMHKNPFYRAFRVGKLTVAALEATLRLFLEPETLLEKHRLMSLLTAPLDGIRRRAESLAQEIAASCANWLSAEAQPAESEIGGGSLAGYPIPTVVVRLQPEREFPPTTSPRACARPTRRSSRASRKAAWSSTCGRCSPAKRSSLHPRYSASAR